MHGVPAGTTLTPSGGLTISTAGTVINGRDITGQVVVNAPNVTIRNSRIRSNAMLADRQQQHRAGGGGQRDRQPARGSGQNNCHVGIGNSNFTVRRTEITGCENGLDIERPGNVTLDDSYVHDLDTTGPSYVWGNDAAHRRHPESATGAATSVIRHNTIDPSTVTGGGGTSAIIMYAS